MILSDHSETHNSEFKLGSRSCCKRHVITQGELKMFLDQHALLVLDTTLLSNTHHLSFTKQRPSLRIKSSMPKWYSASRYDGLYNDWEWYSFISVPLVNKYRVSVSSIQKESRQWYMCDPVVCTDEPGWTRRRYYMRRKQADTLEGTWLHPVFKWPAARPPCLKLITWLKTTFVPDRRWRRAALRSSSEGLREDCVQIAGHLGEAVKGNENVMLASCTERIVWVDEVKFDEVLQVSKKFSLGSIRDRVSRRWFNGCDSDSIQGRWFQICTTAKFCLTWLKRVIEEHNH